MSETEHEQYDVEVEADALLAVTEAAAALEGEEGLGDESDTGEPAAPPEAVGPSPEEWEDRFKKIAARFKTYTRAVGTILEEDAVRLLECPMCEGAVPGFVNADDAGKMDEETVGAVQAFIGYEAPQTLNKSRLNTRCVECGGHGKLDTDSLVPEFAERVCDGCNGFGYRGPGNPMDAPGPPPPQAVEPANGPPGIDLTAALASIQERQGT